MGQHAQRGNSVRRWIAAGALGLTLAIGAVAGVSGDGGGRGGGGPGGGGPGGATINAINGTQLSLTTPNGWTRTLDAAGATITEGDAEIAITDLAVGDEIRVHEARNFDGSQTVTEIVVVAPNVAGTITAVTDTSLTIQEADGTSRTVTLADTTTYSSRESATRDALAVGSMAHVEGVENADGSFTATSVSVRPAHFGGTVTATGADSITVSDASGATATIRVTASTTYGTEGATGSLADIAVGDMVRAQGVTSADGTLTASSVHYGAAGEDFGGHGGFGGRGPRG